MLDEDEKDDQKPQEEAEQTEDETEDTTDEEVGSKSKAKANADSDDDDDSSFEDSFDDEDNEELKSYAKGVKKRVDRLTFKRREAERREREALEYAKAIKAELDAIKKREASISKSFETEAETRLSAQEELLRNNLRLAVDSGDVDKQVEIQTNLVKLATDKERLRNFKAYRQETEAAPQRQPEPQPQRVQPRPDPKAQSWATKNTWFGSDRIMTQAAYTIHEDLLSEGYDATGDDYYNELDSRIRREFPQKFQSATPKKPASAVASARPGQAKKVNKDIELTDTQKSIANKLGVSYDAYKRQLKLAMEKAN